MGHSVCALGFRWWITVSASLACFPHVSASLRVVRPPCRAPSIGENLFLWEYGAYCDRSIGLRVGEQTGAFVIATLEVKFLDRRKNELLRKHLPKNVSINQETKLEDRRRSDTALVRNHTNTMPAAIRCVPQMTRPGQQLRGNQSFGLRG
ncbi:hypothetical protein JTE90_004221, partial [Oedothorax gibbosus]